MTPSPLDDRRLLVSVHRWARTNGWRVGEYGWMNGPKDEATINVKWSATPLGWSAGEIGIARATERLSCGRAAWSCTTWIRVASAVQAIDVLVALDILPAWLSSPYALAVDRHAELIEALEEDLARADHCLRLNTQTIAGLQAENAELRVAAARTHLATIGGAR